MLKRRGFREGLAVGEGLYYALTGVWSLVHLSSFMRVTGPKTDDWLVKTVGGLVTITGATLFSAGRKRRITPEIVLLGAGQPLAFMAIEIFYTANGRISKIYLADAALQSILLAGWGYGRRSRKGWSRWSRAREGARR